MPLEKTFEDPENPTFNNQIVHDMKTLKEDANVFQSSAVLSESRNTQSLKELASALKQLGEVQ